MLTNFIRAKVSTHSLLVAIGIIGFAGHHFFSDPRAAAWLASHWVLKLSSETVWSTLIAYGIYKQPTKPSA